MNFLNMFKIFVYPARIIYILAYAHSERVVVVFVAQLTCCILVDSHGILRYSCMYISDKQSANVT